nr:InfA [Trichosanthes cucumerina]UTQ75403.1 InfA [Trichosanthes cucumerina]
MKEQKRDL